MDFKMLVYIMHLAYASLSSENPKNCNNQLPVKYCNQTLNHYIQQFKPNMLCQNIQD